MIRIITDSASDTTISQAQELGIDVVPLETAFDDGPCPMNTQQDFDRFYEKLKAIWNSLQRPEKPGMTCWCSRSLLG